MAEVDAPRVRYRFPPLERRGIIAGWRGGQIASVAAALVVSVLLLRARPSIGGLLLAVLVTAGGVAVAFWPVRGRTPEQWLPLVLRWSVGGRGGRRQRGPGPRAGHGLALGPGGPGGAGGPGGPGGRPRLRVTPPLPRRGGSPAVFDGLRLVEVPVVTDGGPVALGVVRDRRARTATAALAVGGQSFALLSAADQAGRVAAWASVLASLAREGSAVHRVQWIESCLPDDGTAVRSYVDERAVLAPGRPARRSYATLLEEVAPVSRSHRVVVSVSVHTSRMAPAIRAAGGGAEGCGAVLGRELLSLWRSLEDADVRVDGAFGPTGMARLVGAAHAPSPDGPAGPAPSDPSADDGRTAHWPWPMTVCPDWNAVRTDATWHVTYWVAEWPRLEVTPDFLGPLLLAPLRRTIALVMEPVPPSRAARQVARARTADIADGELRRRSGFLVSARHHRERHSVEERDAELADGHGQYRFAGYVTVTADSRRELEAATAAAEQLAAQSHLELRRLYGEQDVAYACSLPLGRGLS